MKLRSELNRELELLSETAEYLREQALTAPSLEIIETLQGMVAEKRMETQSMLDDLNAGNLAGKGSPVQKDGDAHQRDRTEKTTPSKAEGERNG